MVRNKRAAPAAPPTAALSPPLVQTVPWSADRRKPRAPPPPSSPTTMPTSVEKTGGVLPPLPARGTARFCLGPYERRGVGAAADSADGGSLGMDSEGSSTDVGVCMDDSASDASQESLVTSDSAVSSPPARRIGRRSPGAGSTDGAAISPGATQKSSGARTVSESRSAGGKASKTQTVSINWTPAPAEKTTSQVISVNGETVQERRLDRSAVNVVSTSPASPKAVSVVELSARKVPSAPSSPVQVSEAMVSPLSDQKQSQTVKVSATPKHNNSSKQNSPSPTTSRASSVGSSTVFLTLEQPTTVGSTTAKKLSSSSKTSPTSSPSPTASPAPPASASTQGSTSTVFLSPSQPDSKSASAQKSNGTASPGSSFEKQQTSSATSPSLGVIPSQQTLRKTKSPRKPPAPLPPVSPSPAPSESPEPSVDSTSTNPSTARAALRQLQSPAPVPPPPSPVQTRTFAERQRRPCSAPAMPPLPEPGFQFHLREAAPGGEQGESADGFAGVRDFLAPAAPIHSSRGTVRGVKDRVRAGIATFLQDNSTAKALKVREQGRLVVYVTSMGIVRPTYQQCQRVRQILRQLMAEFEERDLFLSVDHQQELQRRLGADRVTPPQVFIDGNLLGGAEVVERLNETGELRRMLKRFKMVGPPSSCGKCGGFRMLPCTSCNGSKKSCHRNHFTEQWVVLRCGACDQSGLIRCDLCLS
ncbi:glutaredoxin domain-containing cysteine-rich protein CG12206-like isoform X1 [Amphibalanus amphitrite]|uniref:glutaredoxin domain-containing cysteine-rich protein CG12206-like isoform X1 n=1 Tax=Amphibalanus amphitrite TaxID=1232801 RepID=UPI001C8FA85E|nr:glutaredoxin domain-containing cysteine-rich protein CG12206-like isoform X1 [Amphibalanus amphitrite]